MCDMKQYEEIYEKLKTLTPDQVSDIIFSSDNRDLRSFYSAIGDYILQQRQAEVIKKGIF